MNEKERPNILFVDDEPDSLRPAVEIELGRQAKGSVVHPREVELPHLKQADLVLVDFRLESWPERDEQTALSLRPATGLALAALLREHVDRSERSKLTAFALHSGHLDDIRVRLPSFAAQHVIARLNNLEWAFPKAEARRYDQMCNLADAVRRLPRTWPKSPVDTEATVMRLLGMDENGPSFDRCWRDVQGCRVPVTELTQGAHAIVFVRWLLHQVLPYPCFLLGEHWVAARLRITLDSLRIVENGDSRLGEDLRSMRYTGILAEFMGSRWWRGVLEDYIWTLGGSHALGSDRLRCVLDERAKMQLERVERNPAVVCLDENLRTMETFFSPDEAVPIRPDYWPVFAESAWMEVDAVRADPDFQTMVDPIDRYRIVVDDD